MVKTIKTALFQILIILGVVFITMGNYHPPMGFFSAKELEPGIVPPPGYSKYINELEKYKYAGLHKLGQLNNGYRFGPIGIYDVKFDTTGWNVANDSPKIIEKFLLTIYGLYIKENSKLNNAEYVVDKAQPFILKNSHREVLPFYLDVAGQQRNKQEKTITVMFPVNKTTRVTLIAAWFLGLAFVAFCVISIFFGGLVRLIQEIAKGQVFNEINIRILKNICYVSFGIPLLYLIGNLLLWLYVQIIFPGGLGLDPQLYFITGRLLLIGVFFYTLYHAFKKGYAIQQESELTV